MNNRGSIVSIVFILLLGSLAYITYRQTLDPSAGKLIFRVIPQKLSYALKGKGYGSVSGNLACHYKKVYETNDECRIDHETFEADQELADYLMDNPDSESFDVFFFTFNGADIVPVKHFGPPKGYLKMLNSLQSLLTTPEQPAWVYEKFIIDSRSNLYIAVRSDQESLWRHQLLSVQDMQRIKTFNIYTMPAFRSMKYLDQVNRKK